MGKYGFTTTTLHSDRRDTIEHGSIHKPIHTAVAYSYEDSRDLAAVFQGKQFGYSYGRQINPTIEALQHKITQMEKGIASVAFATGMGAIATTLFALLRKGDHIISSAYLFGNTNSLFKSFETHGIEVSFVDATNMQNIAAAHQDNTKLVFVETIANPRTQVADLASIGDFCAQHELIYFVDNTMTSPYLFRPKKVNASLVINSLTKYIGGHGNVLGGTITDTGIYDWSKHPHIYDNYKNADTNKWAIQQIKKKGLRDFGATLSAEAAHHIAIGSETLSLRLERICHNAQTLAKLLFDHPKIQQVYYPGLSNHPQHQLAQSLFRGCGGIMSFELDQSIDCFDFLNQLDVVISSSNLGDNRTLGIPVAHTIYYEMGPQRRESMGIKDSLIRISVGIEDTDDLIDDFLNALDYD